MVTNPFWCFLTPPIRGLKLDHASCIISILSASSRHEHLSVHQFACQLGKDLVRTRVRMQKQTYVSWSKVIASICTHSALIQCAENSARIHVLYSLHEIHSSDIIWTLHVDELGCNRVHGVPAMHNCVHLSCMPLVGGLVQVVQAAL